MPLIKQYLYVGFNLVMIVCHACAALLCCALIIMICDTLYLVPRMPCCIAFISCAGLANWFNRLCRNTIGELLVRIFLFYYMNWLLDKIKFLFDILPYLRILNIYFPPHFFWHERAVNEVEVNEQCFCPSTVTLFLSQDWIYLYNYI